MKVALFKNTRDNQRGASLVEYSILIALILLVAIIGVAQVGEGVRDNFQNASEVLTAGESFECGNPPLPPCQ